MKKSMFLYILFAAAADFVLYGAGRLLNFSGRLSEMDAFGCILSLLLVLAAWLVPHFFADGNPEGNHSYRWTGVMLILAEKTALAFLYIRWTEGSKAAAVICLTAIFLGFLFDVGRISLVQNRSEAPDQGKENGRIVREAH